MFISAHWSIACSRASSFCIGSGIIDVAACVDHMMPDLSVNNRHTIMYTSDPGCFVSPHDDGANHDNIETGRWLRAIFMQRRQYRGQLPVVCALTSRYSGMVMRFVIDI